MRYCLDLDGTLCTVAKDYAAARPIAAAVERVRTLHAEGHRITLWTARGTTTGIDWRDLTERQLAAWGVPYHELHFGKPEADLYIDDRALNAHGWAAPATPLGRALADVQDLAIRTAFALSGRVEAAATLIRDALQNGNKVLVCGNGGSAADAQHFAAELVGHMRRERRPYPAIALSSDPSVVTAIGNDYGWNAVFARQVAAHGRPGDVLLAISTSGRSENVLAAILEAKTCVGMRAIALVGGAPDGIVDECDVVLSVPSQDTQRVQEMHTVILHTLCAYLEPQEEVYAAGSAIMASARTGDAVASAAGVEVGVGRGVQ